MLARFMTLSRRTTRFQAVGADDPGSAHGVLAEHLADGQPVDWDLPAAPSAGTAQPGSAHGSSTRARAQARSAGLGS